MSTSELFSVTSEAQRQTAINHLRERELFFWVRIYEKLRTVPQNDRLHPMIRPIAKQLLWHGQKLSEDDWRLLFVSALNREMRVVPNLDNTGFVQLGRSSRELPVADFSDLMTLIEAFAAQHGIALEGV